MAIATSKKHNIENIKIEENFDYSNIKCCIPKSSNSKNIKNAESESSYSDKNYRNDNCSLSKSKSMSDSLANKLNEKSKEKNKKIISHDTSVAERIQQWNRAIPQKSYVTLGTIRYGIRLSTNSDPNSFCTERTSNSSSSRSLPPTPYATRSNTLTKYNIENDRNHIKSNSSLNSSSNSRQKFKSDSIINNSSTNINNNCSNSSINNSYNNIEDISNKETNSSDSKTSSIYHSESENNHNSIKKICCKTACCCLCKKGISIPCWNKNLCNRNNNDSNIRRKCSEQDNDIPLETFTNKSANYRIPTRTTTTTSTAKSSISRKIQSQYPSTSSSLSSTSSKFSPSVKYSTNRSTVMSAPKVDCSATSTTLSESIAETATVTTTTSPIPQITDTTRFDNHHKIILNEDNDAPIPPIRTTSQIPYFKSLENNNGKAYNNANVNNNYHNNNNTVIKTSRLKQNQKNSETKNLTKIPTAVGNNSHVDNHSAYLVSSTQAQLPSISSSSSSISQSPLLCTVTTLSPVGSITNTRILTKNSIPSYIQTYEKGVLHKGNTENYSNHTINQTKSCNNCFLNQQQKQYNYKYQQPEENHSIKINGSSSSHYHEKNNKMCQTSNCSCSNTKNSAVKNSNDHVCSHHEIKNTTDEQQNHQQQQNTNENEFGQISRDNFENSESVLAETRTCKFTKKISPSSVALRENFEKISYPLQNSKSLPISSSLLTKNQNPEHINISNNNKNNEKNGVNNYKIDFIQRNGTNENCTKIKSSSKLKDIKDNSNFENQNDQNNYENILIKNNSNNFKCGGNFDCSCSNNNKEILQNQNNYLPQPQKLYTGGSIPRAIIQQTLDTVAQRSLGTDRKNFDNNGYDKTKTCIITPCTNNGFNTLRQRRLSPPPPVPPKPNRHQQVVRSKSVDSNVNNYQYSNDSLIENKISSNNGFNNNQKNKNDCIESNDSSNVNNNHSNNNNSNNVINNNNNNCDSVSISSPYDPSKFRRKLLKFEQKNFIIKKSPSAGLDLLNCFAKSNTTDENSFLNRRSGSSNDLFSINNIVNTNNIKNKSNNYQNGINRSFSYNTTTTIDEKLKETNGNHNDVNNKTDTNCSPFLKRKISIPLSKNCESDPTSEIKLYSNTTPSVVIRKLTPKLTRKTLNFGSNNDSNSNTYIKNRADSEDRLIDDNSSDNNDLNSYCDSLGSVNDPIIETHTNNNDKSNSDPNFLIFGEPIPLVPIYKKTNTIISPLIDKASILKCNIIDSHSNDDIGFIDSSEKEDSDFDSHLISTDNNQYCNNNSHNNNNNINNNNENSLLKNILDYPKSVTIQKNSNFNLQYDSKTKLSQLNKTNDKIKFINETNNNTINNNNNAIIDNTNTKINDNISINDRIIFKDFYDSLSDSLEASTISCLSETTTATTTTTDLLTNINCGCRFQNNNNNNNSNNNIIINSNDSNISINTDNDICNSSENIKSDVDLCLLNNINENGLNKSSDLCCCNERVKRFCRELKNQEADHNKNLQNNNNNNNESNNKQIRIVKSNSENFIKNKEFINQFLVNHLNNTNNHNSNSINLIQNNSDNKNKVINNNNNILIDNNTNSNTKENSYNNNDNKNNITNFDLNYSIIPSLSTSTIISSTISPANSSSSIPLSSLPPLPPPLPPLQFRNTNTNNNNNNNITIENNSDKIRYDWNELSDLNSISYNSSSDSNSIHSNNSNQSSISNTSSSNNNNCCGGNNNHNLQKNIQFKKISAIESFGYINNNNLLFGKLRNIEDNNSIQDKEQSIKSGIKNNMERRRNTLDRLQDQIRLNFGRRSSPSPTQQEKQRKSAEKSEKLRELTELLRGTSSTSSHSNRFSPTPPPIPPPRKPRHGSQQSSFEKSTEKLPPDPGPPPSPISPLRAADSEDILPMDQEAEDEPHRYSAPQLTSSTNNREKIVQSPSPPPLPPPPPPPLPPQPLFSTQSTININLKSKKHKENKPLTGSTHDSIENNNKSLLMSSLRPNSSVSNLEAFIFGRNGRGKSKSPPPYTALLTKSTSKDESTSTEDDICTSLPKPESRTIIGSYTQKGIPYRSASFSQVDYSSGKYVKSALNAFRERFRKSQDKNQSDSGGDNNAIILSRKKDDQESEETKPKEPDFIYIPLKKSELNINLRYDENEKPSLENRVNPPEIIMEEDSQISELDSPMRTEADCSEDISEASDSVIVPTTILEDKSDENQNKIFPKSSPINVSREGSATSELTNSNEKDLLMESPPDKVKTTTTCLIPIPIYESTDVVTTESKDNVTEDSVSTEGIPTVLNEESNNDAEKAHETHLNADSPDNVPRISVSQNTPQGSIDEEAESPNIAAEINPERLSVEQTFDDQPTVPTLVEEVLNRPLEFTEVKKRYSNEAAIGDRSHSADSILSRGGSSDEKRKRDKSKRRMGLYFQWPAVETSENTQTSSEWDTSIDSTAFEDKNNLALDITKVDFSNLKSDSSQNDTLSLFLNDTLNQSELIQTPESGYICEISTPESESYIKPKIWSRFNRRTSLTCQSSEEKDDGSSPAPSVNRSNRNLLCFKNDSTSDNESDRTPPPSRDRTSPSPAPGDSDFKRYSKRPLRGPYGQMLEAEMKKPGKVHYDEIFEELKENDNLGKTHGNRSRIQNNRSFDETRTIPQHSNSMRVRKTANLPIPTHTRAASTPSQMESTSSSPGSNRISSKDIVGSLEESNGHLTKGKSNKKYSNDMHRERSPKRASSEAPDIKLINFAKRSPSSASDRHQFLQDKSQKRSFEEMRFSQSSRTNSERSTISESSKSGGGSGVVNNQTNIGTLMPSPELLAALLKGSSERQISEQRQQTIVDTRNHIVEEIYRTEASYVDALTTIVTKYYNVLKTPESAGLIDTKAVDEIFFMTTELLSIHKKYYNDLKSKSDPLDPTLCCESFLETFSQTEVLETYTCFVNNRDRAHEAVKTAVQARPAFGKFLESTAREQKGKLTLDNLLIKPIQKFVNYEMLFTRLLKHTDSDIDQKPIQDVLKLVHDILVHLDCKKKEINENGQREDALRQYETYIEGISDLVAPERQFLIYDLVQLPSNHTSNHMRGLFLFSDLLVLTSIKRRSGAIKKQDFRSNTSTLDITFASTLENIKYKFLRKFPIEYVEIVKTQDENARRIEKDYEQLVDDRNKIQQIDQIQTSIKFQSALHQVLEQTIRNYLSEVETRLTECERQLNDGQLNSLKFMINIPGDSQHVTVLFSKAERRAKWEEIFNDAKQKLAACLERHPTPEFLRSIALRKTRAGLQFTCAAPTLTDQKDVWVCNSDGYIGQVAVLSIQENPPTVSSCNGVCNARILCIASVPAYKETRKSQSRQSSTEEPPQSCRNSSSSDNSKKTSSSSNTTATTTTTVTANIKESNSMPAGISTGSDLNEIQLDSNSSSDDSDPEQLGNISGTNNETNISGNVNVGGNQINTILDSNNITNPENRISSPIPKTISSMSNLSTIHHQHQDSNSEDMESQQSTMWLGTEDGCIHVYNSTDNIRIKKNKIKIEHLSSVYSILYYDNRVFVSLANGDICVYLRDNVGWNTSHPLCISIGTVSSPVNKLLNVNGKLWCTIQGTIKVLDTKTLQVESTIQISSDSKPITNMAICNNCVWISIQNSAVIKCFHSTSHELIFEVNLAPSVNKMLSNCDDIIRQHKAACLRVTSLLACKDLIWIGTSAGVLLTIPAQSYIKGQTNNIPIVTGIPHGHTGHVRFLTSVESNIITATSSIISSDNQEFDTISSNNSYNLNNNNNNNNNYNNNNNNNSIGNSNTSNNRSNSRTRSEIGSSNNLNSSSMTTSKYSSKSVDSSLDRKSKRNTIHNTKDKTKAEAGKTLIISGGDGYENFGNSNSNSPSEIAGREDSTNHLLLWQI